MTVTEKSAYLKGLVEGSELNLGDKEKKVFDALLDLIDDMAQMIQVCDDDLTELYDEVDALDGEVDEVNDVIDAMLDVAFEDEDEDYEDEDDDDFEPHHHHHHHDHCHCCDCDEDDLDDDDFDDEDYLYDVECPACSKEFSCDEDTILGGSVTCPFCGEKIEFDLSECCDEDCDCCCEDCE